MASWLASQLQKAENLLEAVDRTVSSATSQQARGPDSGGTLQHKTLQEDVFSRLTTGPFKNFTAPSATQAAGSPTQKASTQASFLQSGTATAGPPLRPAATGTAQDIPVASQQQQLDDVSHAPAQPLQLEPLPPQHPDAAQPSSTGAYTIRTHGPFSPSPEQNVPPQLHQPSLSEQTALPSWGPPPRVLPSVPAALSGSTDRLAGAAVTTTDSTQPAENHSTCKPAPSVTAAVGLNIASDNHKSNTEMQLAAAEIDQVQQQQRHVEVMQDATMPSEGTGGQPASTSSQASEASAATANAEAVGGAPEAAFDHESTTAANGQSAQQESHASATEPAIIAAALQAAIQEQQHHQQAPTKSAVQQSAAEADATQHMQPASSADSSSGAPGSGPSSQAGGTGTPGNETQLMRLVETLRKRLDQIKAENQQLEDLVHSAEQATAAEQHRAQQLAAELSSMQRAQEEIVTSAAANAAVQDARIGQLQQDVDAANRQVVALQGALEAIQEQHQQVLSSKDAIEGGALEALRNELSAAESQLEAERKAHAATKATSAARERDLEEQLASSGEALAATQRQMEELASRSRDLEEQQALTVAEAARLSEQVRQLSQQQAVEQPSDPAQQLQHEAEKEALAHRLNEAQAAALAATQAQRAAEAQAAALQQEIAHLHSSYQASAAASRGPPQLEQQVQELQDLLYQKQQQLERMSGEKQGQLLLLERQVAMLKSELGKAHAAAAAAQTSVTGRHDIIPMDALGEPYQRLARHRKLGSAVQAAANFLDRTAASATQLLRQQPLVRLVVFLYIVLIHVYVYFLLARMQRQAVLMLSAQERGAAVHEPVLPGTH